MVQWAKIYKKKYKTGPPFYGHREPACLDRPDGMPGQHWVRSQGVQVVPNSWRRGCCRSLSTRPGKAVPTPCDGDQPYCPGSGELPTHRCCFQLVRWWWVYGSVGD